MDSIDGIVLGRKTYEMFAQYWPNVQPGADDKIFADKINSKHKYVVSSTLRDAKWGNFGNATVVRGDVAAELARIKQASSKDLVLWGSISLAQSLLAAGVIDEYQIIVCAVVLGSGIPLFQNRLDVGKLKLRHTQSFDGSNVLLSYGAKPPVA